VLAVLGPGETGMPESESDPRHQQEDRTLRTFAGAERVIGRRRPQLKLRFYDDPIELEQSLEAKAAC
jgi:hypothetical protein